MPCNTFSVIHQVWSSFALLQQSIKVTQKNSAERSLVLQPDEFAVRATQIYPCVSTGKAGTMLHMRSVGYLTAHHIKLAQCLHSDDLTKYDSTTKKTTTGPIQKAICRETELFGFCSLTHGGCD